MSKRKVPKGFSGPKRVKTKSGYRTNIYENGVKVGSRKWHGSNAKALADWVKDNYEPQEPPTGPDHEPPPKPIPPTPPGTNTAYNELVYYAVDRKQTGTYYLEVRLWDVVLPPGMTPDDLVESIIPFLSDMAEGRISDVRIGSSGAYPTNAPVNLNSVQMQTCVKTAGKVKNKSNSDDGRYAWNIHQTRVRL